MRHAPQSHRRAGSRLALLVALPLAVVAATLVVAAGDEAPLPLAAATPQAPMVAAPVAATTAVLAPASASEDEAAPARSEAHEPMEPIAGTTDAAVVVHVDGAAAGVPLVVTRTNASATTQVTARSSTDDNGTSTLPRAMFQSGDAAAHHDVVCVDLAFPTLGACAAQVDAAATRVDSWLPPLGTLRVRVAEADGTPVPGLAFVRARVTTATPPADREHVLTAPDGAVATQVEAAGLSLLVQATTADGRTTDTRTVIGPQIANATTEVELRLPPHPRFHLHLHAPGVAEEAIASVQLHARLGERTWLLPVVRGAHGQVTFPAPVRPPSLPVQLQWTAQLVDGRVLVAQHTAELHAFARSDLGRVELASAPCLARGRCLDAAGRPAVGQVVVVQGLLPSDGGNVERWHELPGARGHVGADGTFAIFGPAEAQRRRVVVVGNGMPMQEVWANDGEIELQLPKRRSGWRS